MRLARGLFARLGLQAKLARCVLLPTQRVELLGYTLASVYMACTRPECQVLALQEAARDVWHRLVTEQGGPVRKLERLRAIRPQRPTRCGRRACTGQAVRSTAGTRRRELGGASRLLETGGPRGRGVMGHTPERVARPLLATRRAPTLHLHSDAARVGWGGSVASRPAPPEVAGGSLCLVSGAGLEHHARVARSEVGPASVHSPVRLAPGDALFRTDNIATLARSVEEGREVCCT